MSIVFENNDSLVHMSNSKMSYIIEVIDHKYLVHRYFGKRIRSYHHFGETQYYKRGYNTTHEISIENASFDEIPFEYPTRGNGDFRIPAVSIQQVTNIEHIEFTFKDWRILDKKPTIDGLPSIHDDQNESETLEIICEDTNAKVRLYLYYTFFKDRSVILRHQKIENYSHQTIYIQNIKSTSLELKKQNFDFISLYGTHAKEGNINRFPLHQGIQKIESVRGSSSPQHQPFFALVSQDTNEYYGEVYAFHLIYSGNFSGEVEVDQFGNIRCLMGINQDTFCWELKSGECFESPEAVMNYSNEGLNGMSQNFHWLYQYHLIPQNYAQKTRPVLLNSWESMYYDVSLDKINQQADLAKQVGIELFVLDDGWFRDGLTSSSPIGDWKCNENKIPGGIKEVANLIHNKGLKFGLWFEPEAVSQGSELMKNHPDWILHIPDYNWVEGRHEFILDLSLVDVQDYLKEMFDNYLKDGDIDYIKWDMNRPLTNVNSLGLNKSQKGEIYHRYILGLYRVLDYMKTKYPHVLIEGCSSGGARFDPGMLYYVPQNWTSDNTDALDRVTIQSGMSLLYPPIIMTAHVSITPNHQTGRITPLNSRFQVARFANLGYELDLSLLNDDELKEISLQIESYKKDRELIQMGHFYRHDILDDNYMMWSIINEDRSECITMIFQKYYNPLTYRAQFKNPYLNEYENYIEIHTRQLIGGDELVNIGFSIPLVKEDFHVFSYHFINHKKG